MGTAWWATVPMRKRSLDMLLFAGGSGNGDGYNEGAAGTVQWRYERWWWWFRSPNVPNKSIARKVPLLMDVEGRRK
jgi:hypothetical protein